ncbi:N/A [soil metagenome]
MEGATAVPDARRAGAGDSRDRRRVWFVSAVQQENVESTTHIFARLAEALSEVFVTGVLTPPPRQLVPAPRDASFGRWFLSRFRRALVGSLRVFARALREVRPGDVVMVVTNPPMLPVLMSVVSRLRRTRLIIVVHDVYPDVLYATGLMPVNSVTGRLLDRLARGALRRADRVVVIGRDMKRHIESKLGGASAHVIYIPSWADPDIAPRNVPDADVTRPLVVQYSGNMGVTHPVETLLDCAELLQQRGTRVQFEVFGWGLRFAWFSEEMERRGLRNITLGAPCLRPLLGSQLARGDVALVLMRRNMTGISVPCRAYNIMAAGRGLIVAADAGAEVATMVREHALGWVVPPQDAKELADAVEDATRQREELRAMGSRAAGVAASEYAFDRVIQKYAAVIEGVWSQSHNQERMKRHDFPQIASLAAGHDGACTTAARPNTQDS